MSLNIEHFALNVSDPVAMCEWYGKHLGFVIARKMDSAPFTHFLRDPHMGVMLEIYCNPPGEVPDYGSMNPLQLHIAFATDNIERDTAMLQAAGASLLLQETIANGTKIAMFRDPWGLAIQLCQRTEGFFNA